MKKWKCWRIRDETEALADEQGKPGATCVDPGRFERRLYGTSQEDETQPGQKGLYENGEKNQNHQLST